MAAKRNVLITGATGFLGSHLLKELLDDSDVTPLVLSRGKRGVAAADRVAGVLAYFYGTDDCQEALSRIRVIEGEVDSPCLGLGKERYRSLVGEVEEIYHSAAIAEFRIPLDRIRQSNVGGTRNILDLAMAARDTGRFRQLNHISTTFVGGTKRGVFYESELQVGQDFHNTYERSKYEAETLVRSAIADGLPATIFRPSILTGASTDGRTSNFKMLYQPLHFFAAELFDAVPGNALMQANLIPVDTVARMIRSIAAETESLGKTYHIASDQTVSLGRFFDLAGEFFGFKPPAFVPPADFDRDSLTPVQKNLIDPYAPYLDYGLVFDVTNASAILGRKGFRYPAMDDAFLLTLFAYCAKTGFVARRRHAVAG